MDKLILLKILIGAVWGLACGIAVAPVSKALILKRSDDPGDTITLTSKMFKIGSVAVSIVCAVCLCVTAADWALAVRNLLFLFPMLCIAVVDSLIRKIPNPLLLGIIGIQAVYLAYACISGSTTEPLVTAGIGCFIGLFCCTIPSFLRVPVGAGDIKYSAVIGLCVYFASYMQSMVIMGLLAGVAYIVLKLTKKGGMKTLVPMGPFLTAGVVITMCFPLVENHLSGLITL